MHRWEKVSGASGERLRSIRRKSPEHPEKDSGACGESLRSVRRKTPERAEKDSGACVVSHRVLRDLRVGKAVSQVLALQASKERQPPPLPVCGLAVRSTNKNESMGYGIDCNCKNIFKLRHIPFLGSSPCRLHFTQEEGCSIFEHPPYFSD